MPRRKAEQAMEAGGGQSPRAFSNTPHNISNKVPLPPHLKVVLAKTIDDLTARNESPLKSLPADAGKKTMKETIREKLLRKYKMPQEKSLARIPAGFDQISFSLFVNTLHPNTVLDIFSEKLGEPIKTYDGFWHHFSNGLKLSRSNKQYYHIIRFSNLAVFNDLAPLLKMFPNKYNYGKPPSPAFQLASAEVKFDYPLPGLSYEEAESILQALALFLMPLNNKYAALKIYSGNKFKNASNGINGKLSFYFGKMHKLPPNERDAEHDESDEKYDERDEPDEEISSYPPWQIKSDSSWRGKAYLKSFDNKKTWNIRIEVTLKGEALRKIGGKSLSVKKHMSEIDIVLQNRLARLCFKDFWKMEVFDRGAFLNEAMPIFEASRGQAGSMGRRIILRLMELEDNQYAIRQKRLAKRLAKMLDSESLKRHLERGKFSRPLVIKDLLQ